MISGSTAACHSNQGGIVCLYLYDIVTRICDYAKVVFDSI